MDAQAAGQTANVRSCGSCTMCCKLIEAPELKKAAHVWCGHVKKGSGCGVHAQRPLSCAVFQCFWTFNPALSDEWRPDRARFIVSVETGGGLVITLDKAQPTAWRREPYHSQIRRWAELGVANRKPVLLANGDRMSVILPNDELDIGALRPGDQVALEHDGLRFHARVIPAAAA